MDDLKLDDYKIAMEQAEKEYHIADERLSNLKISCPHRFIKSKYAGQARCDICGIYSGWWCPDAPNHVCNYQQEDGSFDEDNCRYCGEPEERK